MLPSTKTRDVKDDSDDKALSEDRIRSELLEVGFFTSLGHRRRLPLDDLRGPSSQSDNTRHENVDHDSTGYDNPNYGRTGNDSADYSIAHFGDASDNHIRRDAATQTGLVYNHDERKSVFLPLLFAAVVGIVIGNLLVWYTIPSLSLAYAAEESRSYQMVHQYVGQEQARTITQSPIVLSYVTSDKTRPAKITESITGGRTCSMNQTHGRVSETLKEYLDSVPGRSSRLRESKFLGALSSLNRTFAEQQVKFADAEWHLCLMAETDVASNFGPANRKMQDLELFSSLYRHRLSIIRSRIGEVNDLMHHLLHQEKQVRALFDTARISLGCSLSFEANGREEEDCAFLKRYYVQVFEQFKAQYANRERWYVDILEKVKAADVILAEELEILERYVDAKQDDLATTRDIREHVEPFINAMLDLIATVRAVP